ncbi:F0F1 ATP synthase subunit B [Mariniflexile ostreae]|uniref:ATP synthase subunit b n=1 Tax=Mariniflexile ostreae TaxID=1520892 RepID=A0ABV5F734_9FLAO
MDQLLNDFSPGLFFMQAIILLIIILLMKKFAWKPILDALQDREDGIHNALDSAKKAKLEMQNLQADNERLLIEARAERDAMLKEARDIRSKTIEDAKGEAQEQAHAIIKQAQVAIEGEKKAAVIALKDYVATLSLEIAEKVVRTELSNKDRQLELVETMLDEKSLN